MASAQRHQKGGGGLPTTIVLHCHFHAQLEIDHAVVRVCPELEVTFEDVEYLRS